MDGKAFDTITNRGFLLVRKSDPFTRGLFIPGKRPVGPKCGTKTKPCTSRRPNTDSRRPKNTVSISMVAVPAGIRSELNAVHTIGFFRNILTNCVGVTRRKSLTVRISPLHSAR